MRQIVWKRFPIEAELVLLSRRWGKDQPLMLDLVDLTGEYNHKPTRGSITKDTLPFHSDDQRNWHGRRTVDCDDSVPLQWTHMTSKSDRIWIAHLPPYTNQNLGQFLAELKGAPNLKETVVGKSVKDKDILLYTISAAIPDHEKKVIWLMFRQHSWGAVSSRAGERTIRFLLASDPIAPGSYAERL